MKGYLKDSSFWEYFLMVAKFSVVEELKAESEKEVFWSSEEVQGLEVKVKLTEYKKCERCWQRKPEVGTLENPELCQRCYEVVQKR